MVSALLKTVFAQPATQAQREALERENALLRQRLGELTESVQKVSVTLAEVCHSMNTLAGQATRAAEQSQRMSAASGTIQTIARTVAGRAGDCARSSESTRSAGEAGSGLLAGVVEAMSQVATRAGEAEQVIGRLQANTEKIDSAATVIQGIARRTGLLALNAAIEAARAGESGRGFAVVADEVRKLSDHSAQATEQISQVVQAIKIETGESVQSIGTLARHARDGARQVRDAGEQLQRLLMDVVSTRSSITEIAEGAAGTRREVEVISGIAGEGERQMAALQADLEAAAGRAQAVSEGLFRSMVELEIDSVHLRLYRVAAGAAAEVAALFEQALASGRLRPDDLFDTHYVPVPGSRPPKYRTRFDAYTDQALPGVQERILEAHPELVFAIAVDLRGYCPTHNRRFSRPLTGNYETDLVGNRTKRIFDDPTGRRCGSHTGTVLVQTYKRDTGEVMHDLSVPIRVQGRHWGGFRLGYKAI